jgi:hypothetical protein
MAGGLAVGQGAWKQRGVLCVAVGDGSSPRTAALVAYLTNWKGAALTNYEKWQ